MHIKEKETYDFTKLDIDNADKEEVDTIDMMMSRVFARLAGAANRNVDAYISLENIKDTCKRVFGEKYDIDAIMVEVLQEYELNGKKDSIQSCIYDGSLNDMAVALESNIRQYDVYASYHLDKWYEGCTIAPDLDDDLFKVCKKLYDMSYEELLKFKKLDQKEREDFILGYIDSYVLLTDEVWDKI